MLQRDQFELLSAYLDGEVTAAERREVEALLSQDEQTKQLYSRLLKLRSGFQGLPLTAAQPVNSTVDQVMERLDRPRISRRTWALGGGAIAAAAIGAFTGLFGAQPRLGYQFALQEPAELEEVAKVSVSTLADNVTKPVPFSTTEIVEDETEVVVSDDLMIALDQPLLGLELDGSADLTPMPSPGADVN